jgi:hypothetical protein
MKVMAVGPKRPLTPEQRQKYLPTEVSNTLKLYLDGKIEQFWYRQNSTGVIFLLNVESLEEAKVTLFGDRSFVFEFDQSSIKAFLEYDGAVTTERENGFEVDQISR